MMQEHARAARKGVKTRSSTMSQGRMAIPPPRDGYVGVSLLTSQLGLLLAPFFLDTVRMGGETPGAGVPPAGHPPAPDQEHPGGPQSAVREDVPSAGLDPNARATWRRTWPPAASAAGMRAWCPAE